MDVATSLSQISSVKVARAVLAAEAAGLQALSASLDSQFDAAVDRLAACTGRVVVSTS